MAMNGSLRQLLTVLFSSAATIASAQGEVTKLRYAFAPGQRLIVAFEETNASSKEDLVARSTTQASSVLRCSQTWTVRTVTSDGDATIDMKYDSVITRRNLAPWLALLLVSAVGAASILRADDAAQARHARLDRNALDVEQHDVSQVHAEIVRDVFFH